MRQQLIHYATNVRIPQPATECPNVRHILFLLQKTKGEEKMRRGMRQKAEVSGTRIHESRKILRLKKVVQIREMGGGVLKKTMTKRIIIGLFKAGTQVIDCTSHKPGD